MNYYKTIIEKSWQRVNELEANINSFDLALALEDSQIEIFMPDSSNMSEKTPFEDSIPSIFES